MKLNMLEKPCPIPVIEAKKALKEHREVQVVVDNKAACTNLEKMALGLGYEYQLTTINNSEYLITLINKQQLEQPIIQAKVISKNVVMIAQNKMGNGDEKLGAILIKGYLYSLTQLEEVVSHVIFINSGINLVLNDANTIEDLKQLQLNGTKILVCGTCLN
ncbi:MAG: sulfurtransferase-like selenium metabolism protein YedF [Bacilli bacterium]